jgi:hypothetical protein
MGALSLAQELPTAAVVIEQLGSGFAMGRMPVAEMQGSAAWPEIARPA